MATQIDERDDETLDDVIEQLFDALAEARSRNTCWQMAKKYERMLGFLTTARNNVEKNKPDEAWKRCHRVLRSLAA